MIHTTGANIIVFYGDDAVRHFAEMMNQWSGILDAQEWKSFYFILAAEHAPVLEELSEAACSYVNDENVIFYDLKNLAPSPKEYGTIVWKVLTGGQLRLHLICSGWKTELDYRWMREFCASVLADVTHTTLFILYLMLSRNGKEQEKESMLEWLEEIKNVEAPCFFISDTDLNGSRVDEKNSWHATYLAVLLNCTGRVPLSRQPYSLGYSALNADGSELANLCRSEACSMILNMLQAGAISGTEARTLALPEGTQTGENLQEWLAEQMKQSVRHPKISEMNNAWVTIRMSTELESETAYRRMERFIDLNYAGKDSAVVQAEQLARQVKAEVINRLCRRVTTASIPVQEINNIAQQLKQIAHSEDIGISCKFPQKPFFKLKKNMDKYLDDCKDAVKEALRKHEKQTNLQIYAEMMAATYMEIAQWLEKLQKGAQERRTTAILYLEQRKNWLERENGGNTVALRHKYPNYTQELDNLNIPLSVLTEGLDGREAFFTEDGSIVEKSWDKLIRQAGEVLHHRMPQGYNGRFFDALRREFATQEELNRFFNNYLANGARMYYNPGAIANGNQTYYLVDSQWSGNWFTENTLYADTDNAENLTMYPIGGVTAAECLKQPGTYFQNADKTIGGVQLFGKRAEPLTGNTLFGGRKRQQEEETPLKMQGVQQAEKNPAQSPDVVKLQPVANGHYMLKWPWNGNDKTAMVEATQFGKRLGSIKVISVSEYQQNGNALDFSEDIMEGKAVPNGWLTVTIYNEDSQPLFQEVSVPGRQEIVKYKISGGRLSINTSSGKILERLVLKATGSDGQITYYPLYRGEDEGTTVHEYTGLSLSNGILVEDPTMEAENVCFLQQ